MKLTIEIDVPEITRYALGCVDIRYIKEDEPYTLYESKERAIEKHIEMCVLKREYKIVGSEE